MSNIWDALSTPDGDDAPVFRFTNAGDKIRGTIIDDPTVLPLREFGTDKPKLDRNGTPVMQVLLVLATEQLDGDEHDGRWRVFIDKALLKRAVAEAIKKAGSDGLGVGDEISISFDGLKEMPSGRSAKSFTVSFSPVGDPWAGAGELDDDSSVTV
jgi:hypothetical protein